MEALITTIIPTYKRPNLLRRAIKSVLNQTEKRIKICVYDNASGDETESVVKEFMQADERIKYHCQKENIGFLNNFNYGLKEVETRFFSLLSDDDIILPDFYEKALKGFELFPRAMFICMGAVSFDENLNIVSDTTFVDELKFYKVGEGFNGIISGKIPGTWTAILFRKEIRDDIGLISSMAGPPVDIGYVAHSAARFPFVVMPGIGAMLASHPNSQSVLIGPVNREWLGWYNAMADNIYKDSKIKRDIRLNAKKLFYNHHIKRNGLGHISRGLKEENFDYSRKAAITLKECGYFLIGQFFLVLIWLYQYIKPAKLLLKFILRDRQRRKEQKFLELNKKYANVVEFIKKLNYELEI